MFMEVVFIFKAVDAPLSMKWKPVLITQLFKSSFNSLEGRYHLLVTPILHFCGEDGVTIINIHDIDVFVSPQ